MSLEQVYADTAESVTTSPQSGAISKNQAKYEGQVAVIEARGKRDIETLSPFAECLATLTGLNAGSEDKSIISVDVSVYDNKPFQQYNPTSFLVEYGKQGEVEPASQNASWKSGIEYWKKHWNYGGIGRTPHSQFPGLFFSVNKKGGFDGEICVTKHAAKAQPSGFEYVHTKYLDDLNPHQMAEELTKWLATVAPSRAAEFAPALQELELKLPPAPPPAPKLWDPRTWRFGKQATP